MNRIFGFAFGTLVRQILKERIRRGSIEAVKAYITMVKSVRMAFLGLLALGMTASILVTGLVLAVVGLLGLLPLEARTVSWTLLVLGVLLAVLSGVGLGILFSQRRWLEVSKSYDLMDAALAPWPGLFPPNPMEIFKGTSSASREERHQEGHRTARTSARSEVVVRANEDSRVVHVGDIGTYGP